MFVCGGLARDLQEGELKPTDRCQAFSFHAYEWQTHSVSLTTSRAFAQLVTLPNGTLYVLGGMDADGNLLGSTEYLADDGTNFTNGPEMPESFAHHCSTMINATHLLLSGGKIQRRASQQLSPIPIGD